MAATGRDVKTQELNFILEFLGKEREESQRWWEFFWNMMRAFSELISKRCENGIMFGPYGSAVEYLNCQEPDNAGDVDVMIFPTSDNLIIQEELIEYLPRIHCTSESKAPIIPCYSPALWKTLSTWPHQP